MVPIHGENNRSNGNSIARKNRNSTRLLGVFVFFVTALVLLPSGKYLHSELMEIINLKRNGVQTIGRSISARTAWEKGWRLHGDVFYSTIIYDGHSKEFKCKKEYPVGTQFIVLYNSENPDHAKLASKNDSIIYFILYSGKLFLYVAVTCASIFMLLFNFSSIYWIITGKET